MTFSRPLRMSWLIVGINTFQQDRRLEIPAAAKTQGLFPKRGAHHTEEALAVKRQ
jgi:hypothetical protein